MLLADKKKEANIAEYIVYMWQTEDLIRVYNFELDRINESIIQFLPMSDTEKAETVNWYKNIIECMQKENIQVKGHLSQTLEIMKELDLLHHSLMNTINDQEYQKVFKRGKDNIRLFQSLAKDQQFNEVDVCMNGLYGLLLLRLNNKEVPEDLLRAVEQFGMIMSYLALKYKEKQHGMWN